MDKGYPKPISMGFPGIPNNIEAAMVWSNGLTYFFKGNQYWRYESKRFIPVRSEYPYSMDLWKGLPTHIDAALNTASGLSYFFKGTQFYRYNDGRDNVDKSGTAFWLNCGLTNSTDNSETDNSDIIYDYDREINEFEIIQQ